jgi:protein gp37
MQTKIEWTAAPLPAGADLDWLRGLGLKPMENPLAPGEWLLPGYTFNPWVGCTKWAEGCARCYAEKLMDARYKLVSWGRGQARKRTGPANWNQAKRWNKISQQVFDRYGVKLRVFCGSLCDWADSEVEQAWREDLFNLINSCTGLEWLLLTKRLEVKSWEPYATGMDRLKAILPARWLAHQWPEHVWFGHSVACQDDADRILEPLSKLAATVAANGQHLRIFLSYEPAIGPIDWIGFEFIDWLICGGESGAGARQYHWSWGLKALEWCRANRVPFHFKQVGSNGVIERQSTYPNAGRFGEDVDIDWEQPIAVTGKGNNPNDWPELLPREYLEAPHV